MGKLNEVFTDQDGRLFKHVKIRQLLPLHALFWFSLLLPSLYVCDGRSSKSVSEVCNVLHA
jgi:hypothetical protein